MIREKVISLDLSRWLSACFVLLWVILFGACLGFFFFLLLFFKVSKALELKIEQE